MSIYPEDHPYVSTMNPQQPLRRTLKPRNGGGPGAPLTLVVAVAGVIIVGGGIAYAVTMGHHASAAPAAQPSPITYHPLTATFADVTTITHNVKSKKPGKHGATPSATATPISTPTPGSSPTPESTVNPIAQKLAAKHAAHHVKPAELSSLAFDPNAAAAADSTNPVPTVPPQTAPPVVAATDLPVASPIPEATPVYEPAVVVEARFISQVQPIYPEIAKQQGIQGTTIILATVGPHGNIIDETIGQSAGNRLLDAAAMDAARASRFEAPEADGHPATETYRIVYTFSLNS